uniref:F-box protein CPR1-like n=1 Tax=Erigeron canadensis TaxID=72917 RepID=UPI001CB8C845|nr:F-box protein CPR1-like [Erigeron canadensis]
MAMLQVDIYEQILIRLGVEDLICCKSVCKSWHFLISSNRFIKDHLKHSYNDDCNNTQIEHRRVAITGLSASLFQLEIGSWYFSFRHRFHLLGSSNGLVCISIHNAQLFVVNPLTREVRKLRKHNLCNKLRAECEGKPVLCFGFGYDSSIDDYKVVVGFMKSKYVTCFHVLTLKSNAWTLVGDVNYCYLRSVGVLCNGALHWVMKDPNENKVILSFDLSREKFKQIPQPDDDMVYQSYIRAPCSIISLGIIDECLCIFDQYLLPQKIWKMNHYNVKQSWTSVTHDWQMKNDFVHCLSGLLKHDVLCDKSLCHEIQLCRTQDIIGAPIYVQSLVSPRIQSHAKQKRKKQPMNNKRTVKILKGDITVHRPTLEV